MNLNIFSDENLKRKENLNTSYSNDNLYSYEKLNILDKIYVNVNDNVLSQSKPIDIIPREKFNKRFTDFTFGFLSYLNWENVCLAGGCASNILNSSCRSSDNNDIDLFVFGLFGDDYIKKLSLIISEITDLLKKRHLTYQIYKNNYVVTILINMKISSVKIQIIKREYYSMYQVLAGFDVDSSCVLINNHNIYLSERGMNAFLSGYNVVDLERRSPSYEHRLYKYVQRGFGIYIPFNLPQYNQLYWMNPFTRGFERLMYLLNYQNNRNFGKIFNYLTCRKNTRIKMSISDYEGENVEESEIKKATIANIRKFNSKVSPEFQYKTYNEKNASEDLKPIKADLSNKQFTGSFNPITENEWMSIDDKTDHIGRLNLINDIRSGKLNDLQLVYGLPYRDRSLFSLYELIVIYHPDENFVISAIDNYKRFYQNKTLKNLYGINILDLACLSGRFNIAKYIYNGYSTKEKKESIDKIKNLALMLDSVELIQMIINQNTDFDKDTLDVNKYNSIRISNKYYLDLKTTSSSNTNDNVVISDNTRLIDFFDLLVEYSNPNDLFKLNSEQLNLYLINVKNNNTSYFNSLKNFFISQINTNTDISSLKDFDDWEYIYINKISDYFTIKNDNSDKCIQLLKSHFNLTNKDIDKHKSIDINKLTSYRFDTRSYIFANYLTKYESDSSILLECVNKLYGKYYYTCPDFIDILFMYDNINSFNALFDESKRYLTLHLNNKKLGKSLNKYYLELKSSIIDIDNDNHNIHVTYANVFKNTELHIGAITKGVLPQYHRIENIFGLCPDDYILNKLFTLYTSKNIDLELLENLRNSICKINRQILIINTDISSSYNKEIDLIMKKCSNYVKDNKNSESDSKSESESDLESDSESD